MPTLPPVASIFLQTLQSEAEVVKQFAVLLKLEQASLSKGSTDDLLEFANQKGKLAVQINSLAAQRNTSLAAQGFSADRAGVEAWCAKHPNEKAAANAWASILSLALEARELNRLNGELIQIRLQYNSKALEALRGSKNSLDLYGPDGQSMTQGHGRINQAV